MIDRRQVLKLGTGALTGTLALPALKLFAGETASPLKPELIQRAIPSSGELLPVIGMGTSRTFDTNDNPETLAQLAEVTRVFFTGNGTVIDSSPMYGNAESRVGEVLATFSEPPRLFAATKVWTTGREQGIAQMQESARRMGVQRFDLIAVHNLQDWRTHLATLKKWKAEGKVRYIGITTSHGHLHAELLDIMRKEPLDFVQFSYNIEDRVAERELLPLAQDRGIATMINRPYQRGHLFARSKGQPLPDIAGDLDCDSWGQFYLKFILGHPATTCIIPATSSARHMADNMKANYGHLPDATQRTEMLRIFQAL